MKGDGIVPSPAMDPELILINPWIYDFAAYDLWSKPLGLLYLAGQLRNLGFRIHLLDCLDIHHPMMEADPSRAKPVRRSYGTGKFWKERVPTPLPLRHVTRPYNRYGISTQLFVQELAGIRRPAAVLLTSLMTYWYPGVIEAVRLVKEVHPEVPVLLGGIYARLCPEHALENSGTDGVMSLGGTEALEEIPRFLEKWGVEVPQEPRPSISPPYPAFDLLRKADYVCLLTSTGCPYRCRYCAGPFLNPGFRRREPGDVVEEILFWHREHGIRDFAFYDDALLIDAETRMGPVLEEIARLSPGLRFHAPNALHVREIGADIANLLFASGFRTIRLGLETSDMDLHRELDGKVSEGEFERAVGHLKRAGFGKEDIGAYILAGLPGQSVDSVMETIDFVGALGATPHLAEYSPIPHTSMWEEAVASSDYDIAGEPLFHNNTLFPCWDEARRIRVPDLKKRVREVRRSGP